MNIEQDFEYWVDSLFEEGYDLSNYTWEGLFEYFCENVLSEEVRSGKGIPINPAATPAKPATAPPPAAAKGPTILASKNGIPGTGVGAEWKPLGRDYTSAELQRIRSVGTKRYETQRKAAVSSGKPEDFKSTTQTGREVWSMANSRLAAAADERSRIRGTSQTDNPLMKDFRSRLPLTPSIQSPTLGARLGSSSGNQSLIQNPNAALGAASNNKPSDSQSLTKVTPPPTPQRPQTGRPYSAAEQRLGLGRGRGRGPVQDSFDFSSPSKVANDMAYLYQSIYEGKKKVDQDMDGDNDFADVMIARMVAAGVPRAEAIRRVRNKEYNV